MSGRSSTSKRYKADTPSGSDSGAQEVSVQRITVNNKLVIALLGGLGDSGTAAAGSPALSAGHW